MDKYWWTEGQMMNKLTERQTDWMDGQMDE